MAADPEHNFATILPTELMIPIFQLSATKNSRLAPLCGVCRTWLESARIVLYRNVFLAKPRSAISFIWTLEHSELGQHVRGFTFLASIYEDRIVGRIPSKFTDRLRRQARTGDRLLNVVLRKCSLLISLGVENPDITEVAFPEPVGFSRELLSGLRFLRLDGYPSVERNHWLPALIASGAMALPNLEKLSWRAGNPFFIGIWPLIPKLCKLELYQFRVNLDNIGAMDEFLAAMTPTLRDFRMDSCRIEGICSFAIPPKLRKLVIDDSVIAKEVISTIFSTPMRDLRELEVNVIASYYLPATIGIGLDAMPRFPSLKRLKLSWHILPFVASLISEDSQESMSLLTTIELSTPCGQLITAYPNSYTVDANVKFFLSLANRVTRLSLRGHLRWEIFFYQNGVFSEMKQLRILRASIHSKSKGLLHPPPLNLQEIYLHVESEGGKPLEGCFGFDTYPAIAAFLAGAPIMNPPLPDRLEILCIVDRRSAVQYASEKQLRDRAMALERLKDLAKDAVLYLGNVDVKLQTSDDVPFYDPWKLDTSSGISRPERETRDLGKVSLSQTTLDILEEHSRISLDRYDVLG